MDINEALERGTEIGIACIRSGKLLQAEAIFHKLLQSDPRNSKLLGLLGNVQLHRQDFAYALDCYQRALQLDPQSPILWTNLGAAHQALGNFEQSIAAHRRAIELDPSLGMVWANLGSALCEWGDPQQAILVLRNGIQHDPTHSSLWCNLGTALFEAGDLEQAQQAFGEALKLDPLYVHALLNLIMCSPPAKIPDADVHRLEDLKSNEELPPTVRSELYFALAKIWDTRGDVAQAAAHYQEANRIMRSLFRYDPNAHRQSIDRKIRAFTPELFARLSGIGSQTHQPVFIIGMPRAGTTLLEQILATHPLVHGAGETNGIPSIRRLQELHGETDSSPVEALLSSSPEALAQAANAYMEQLRRTAGPGKTIFIDKLPENYLHLGLIAVLFPRARLIHCVRDPLDTCVSIYHHRFVGHHPYAYEQQELGLRYLEYERLMAHWREVLPIPILEVRYEALVDDLEGQSRRMLEHLSLEWEPACLEFHQTERQVRTASGWQVRQPLYRSALGRAERYAPYLEELVSTLRDPA